MRGNDGTACDRPHTTAFLYRQLERNACGTRIPTARPWEMLRQTTPQHDAQGVLRGIAYGLLGLREARKLNQAQSSAEVPSPRRERCGARTPGVKAGMRRERRYGLLYDLPRWCSAGRPR